MAVESQPCDSATSSGSHPASSLAWSVYMAQLPWTQGLACRVAGTNRYSIRSTESLQQICAAAAPEWHCFTPVPPLQLHGLHTGRADHEQKALPELFPKGASLVASLKTQWYPDNILCWCAHGRRKSVTSFMVSSWPPNAASCAGVAPAPWRH